VSVEGVVLSFLIYTLVLAAAAAAAGWWLWQRLKETDSTCDVRYALLGDQLHDRAPAAHVHEYAAPEHEHQHDHPHNHEHIQHTHTLETMSKHEENGRPVFVKYCGVCKTIFRDIAPLQAV